MPSVPGQREGRLPLLRGNRPLHITYLRGLPACVGSEAHATHLVATRGRRSGLFGLVGDDNLSSEEQRGDGRGVLQRRTRDLGGVDDALGDEVDILSVGRVETPAGRQVADLLGHDATLETTVDSDLFERSLGRDANDVRTRGLVALKRELDERSVGGLYQGHATTGDDALLDCSLRIADSVLDAVLALLELDLRGRARLDDSNATGKLGEALLELLAVVVRVGLVDLGADLVDPARNLVSFATTLDDGRVVLGDNDLARSPELVELGGVELESDLLGDDLATGEDGDVAEHGLATVTEARRLDGDDAQGATDVVHHQGREGLALDVLGDDEDGLAGLAYLVQQRDEVLDAADLGVDDQDVRVLQDSLHALCVGDEVRRDVALVEAHALGQLELQTEGLALLDRDDAFLADLVHGLGDHLADLSVSGRDRGGGSNLLLGLDLLGHGQQLVRDGRDGLLDATLERHRVCAGSNVAQTLAHHRLGQDGRRGGAVTGHVVGLLGNFLDQLCADLLVRILELDLLGDAHAIVGDGGRTPLFLKDDVAALRSEGHLDGVGEDVHSPLETAASLLIESDDFGHSGGTSHAKRMGNRLAPATDGPDTTYAVRTHSPTLTRQSELSLSW